MEDAEDILQETMIKVLEMNPEFENLAHEKAYLFTVAGNLSKNRMKYNKLRRTDELDEVLTEEERADLSFVWHAVKDLPKNYREVIHLYYQEGYQTAEIATILDRREATVRSDLRRGREKLKNVLKEEYDFE
jgi:RNA polymerase sigma-70 factor (ECF subfamily)